MLGKKIKNWISNLDFFDTYPLDSTFTNFTMPSPGDLILFSIFIASRIRTTSPLFYFISWFNFLDKIKQASEPLISLSALESWKILILTFSKSKIMSILDWERKFYFKSNLWSVWNSLSKEINSASIDLFLDCKNESSWVKSIAESQEEWGCALTAIESSDFLNPESSYFGFFTVNNSLLIESEYTISSLRWSVSYYMNDKTNFLPAAQF